jgi:uncharacterized protein
VLQQVLWGLAARGALVQQVIMPWFAIHCIDKPDSADLRAETRPAHLEHINAHREAVLVAGPLLRPDGRAMGSLLIIEFDDKDGALAFANADPYHQAGLFESRSITNWHKVLP